MKEFFKSRFIVVIILIVLFVFGFMAGAISNDSVSMPENIIGTVLSPIQSAFSRIIESGGDFIRSFTEYDNLVKENEQLKQQLLEKETLLAQSQLYITENEQLKQLLNMTQTLPEYEYMAANVVATEIDDWNSVVTINRGSKHGVKKGDTVINSEGIVGCVDQVGMNWSKVITILHKDSSVSAVVTRTNVFAIANGDYELAKNKTLKLEYLSNNVLLNRGDIIQTSGVGGKFPEGLRIGRIESVVNESNGVSQYAVITPVVDFNTLRSVFIITNFEREEDK